MERTLTTALQSGIELVPRPFAELGRKLGLSEDETLEGLVKAKAEGLVRRFGAVFDSAALGFRSTLCAADVRSSALPELAKAWAENPGITHAYVRDAIPSLWFTLTARETSFEAELEKLRRELAPAKLLEMPALKRFKVHAVFGDDAPSYEAPAKPAEPVKGLDGFERSVVKLFQGDLPLAKELYAEAAEALGCEESRLLALLKAWRDAGVVHRVGAICRHRSLGFKANAMCVWSAAPEELPKLGAELAGSPRVSHCCERRPCEGFEFNVYAMLHAKSEKELRELFEKLSKKPGLRAGRMLSSLSELKKSSPQYF